MRTIRYFLAAVILTVITASVWADGFIIVERPWRPPNHPPIRHYAFAPLEVTYHHVDVTVRDQFATTTVDQEFYNPNDQALEGTYLFPIPAGAQVSKFSMEINGKEMEAELLGADKARKIYEDIVRQMRDPALMEYAGRDVFKVRVYPIEARSKKRIKIVYSQMLKADMGLVQYLYPLNTEKFSAGPIQSVRVTVNLEGKRPIKTLYSPSHAVDIRRDGERKAVIQYESKNSKPNTDFQLVYSLGEEDISIRLMAHRPDDDKGYFMLIATPPITNRKEQISQKDVVFVIDTSGSMAGAKINQARKALSFCVENLNEGDRFEIIRFSTETESLFSKLSEVNDSTRSKAETFIKGFKANGSTAIDDAMKTALKAAESDGERPSFIIFLTDGRPTIGITDEDQIVAGVKKQVDGKERGQARIFCFGIGADVNTHLLDKLSEAARGFSQYVLPEEDLEVKLSGFYNKISAPVLANIRIVFPDDVRAGQMYPTPLPDLFQGEQLIVSGRYTHPGKGQIRIEGTLNGHPKVISETVEFPDRETDWDFIPRLWATRRIGYLLDEIRLRGENSELKDEVIELARKYAVVTPYTSWLIQEDETRKNIPIQARIMSQPVPVTSAPMMREMSANKSGDNALAGAQHSYALKSANNVSEALSTGRSAMDRSMNVPSAASSGFGANNPSRTQIAESAQENRYVGGRTFYNNNGQWLDPAIQKLKDPKRNKIQFNSPEYFDLMKQHPEWLPWLALGTHVEFAWNGMVYEIRE